MKIINLSLLVAITGISATLLSGNADAGTISDRNAKEACALVGLFGQLITGSDSLSNQCGKVTSTYSARNCIRSSIDRGANRADAYLDCSRKNRLTSNFSSGNSSRRNNATFADF